MMDWYRGANFLLILISFKFMRNSDAKYAIVIFHVKVKGNTVLGQMMAVLGDLWPHYTDWGRDSL